MEKWTCETNRHWSKEDDKRASKQKYAQPHLESGKYKLRLHWETITLSPGNHYTTIRLGIPREYGENIEQWELHCMHWWWQWNWYNYFEKNYQYLWKLNVHLSCDQAFSLLWIIPFKCLLMCIKEHVEDWTFHVIDQNQKQPKGSSRIK